MKGALVSLSIGVSLLIVLYFKTGMYKSKGTIDVHIYDTYFVLSYGSVILFVLLFSGTFFSIGGLIGTVFRNKMFWILALLFLSMDAYCLLPFYKLISGVAINQTTG